MQSRFAGTHGFQMLAYGKLIQPNALISTHVCTQYLQVADPLARLILNLSLVIYKSRTGAYNP